MVPIESQASHGGPGLISGRIKRQASNGGPGIIYVVN